MSHLEPFTRNPVSKILFIDDDVYDCIRAKRALEERGFEVTFHSEANVGLEAIKASEDWSALVLDAQMPVPLEWQVEVTNGITGLKILQEARDWLMAHRIPVLLYTNRGLDRLKGKLDALNLPPELLDRVEKVMLLTPADFAERVWQLAGRAQRQIPVEAGDEI